MKHQSTCPSFAPKVLSLALVLLLVSITTYADGLSSLTPEQAVQIALTNNPGLLAARILVEEAEARLTQVGLWSNPELDADGRFDNSFNNEGEKGYGIGITQPISVSGRIGAEKKVAQLDIDHSVAEVKDLERRITGQVQHALTEIQTTAAQIDLQEFIISLNTNLLNVAQTSLKRAEISQIDVTTLLIARQQAQQVLNTLNRLSASQHADLKVLLGYPPESHLTVAGQLEAASLPPIPETGIEEAIRHRPDYAMAQLEIEQAGAEQQLAKSERMADWQVGAFYEQDQSVIDGAAPQGLDKFLGIKLTIPLPLFDRKQGRIHETAARGERAVQDLSAIRLKIAAELTDAHTRLTSLQTAIATFTDGDLLAQAESNVRAVEEGYRKGLSDMTAVMQARQQFNELKASYIDTLRDYHLALVDLQTAAGTFPSTVKP